MVAADDLVGQRERRIENAKKLRQLGIDPYPAQAHKELNNQEILDNFAKYKEQNLTLAGRLVSWRDHGKLIFANVSDESGQLQYWFKKDQLAADLKLGYLGWEHLALLDIGDFIEATGKITKTTSGQISLLVRQVRLLAKSLRPLPFRLADKEELLRRRYLDLTIHPEKKALFLRKAKFWEVNRKFLKAHGFMEVETPVLEHVTGGADARPFVTYHNALDANFYLRISTELYQKRLIGAGFEKIFTIGPNFRNEGISEEHLQEYSQVEWYWAYVNYRQNMELVAEMFRHIAKAVYGKTKFTSHGHTFDLADDWKEISYPEIIKKTFNIDIFKSSDENILEVLKKQKVILTGAINRNRLIDNLWKLIRKTVSGPAFLVNEPKFMSPLAKSKPESPELTERFHVVIAGSELGNGYSEINDPQDQLECFLEQQKLRQAGDEEAQMLDLDYVEMLEYGMPPASGYAHSERLFWFLENVSGREAMFFPQLSFNLNESTKKIYGPEVIKYTKTFAEAKQTQGTYYPVISTDKLTIDAKVKQQWPSVKLGYAVIEGVKIKATDPKLEALKKVTFQELSTLTKEAMQQSPEIVSYRKLYKETGVDLHSRYPSPEALLRRVISKKEPYRVNTCVDAYNLIVMKYRVSIGAFDLDQLKFPTVLKLAKGGEQMILIGEAVPTELKAGEICYFDTIGPYNLDFNYRDANRTKVKLETKNIILNIDGVYEITRYQIERSLKESIKLIQEFCGGKVKEAGVIV